MGEFFKGWRRKAGLVTLAMALALTGLWLRSLSIVDLVGFPQLGRQQSVTSSKGSVSGSGWVFGDEKPEFTIFPDAGSDLSSVRDLMKNVSTFQYREWVIPYWSLVMPLALLSAWLILAKPRKAKAATGSTP